MSAAGREPPAAAPPTDEDRRLIQRVVTEAANRALQRGAMVAAILGVASGLLVFLLMALRILRDVQVAALFALVAGGYSALLYLAARARRLEGGLIHALMLPFVSLPTLFFLAAHAVMPWGAATFITGPFSFLYFVVIVVTGFFFDQRLPRLAGFVAAAEYFGCYLLAAPKLALVGAPDAAALQDLTSGSIYALKTTMMIACGYLVGALATTARGLVVRALQEEREKQGLSRLFGQFVSPEVKERIIRDKLGVIAERRQVAVLFSDIRSFTTRAEEADAEALVAQLNEYFDAMVTAITGNGGVVDKFVGDAIMAVFGGVIDLPNPATAALDAAGEMQRRLADLNAGWARRGIPPIAVGIGIHHGEVVQGTIGSAERKDFTVIGDAVNTAARLETLTKEKGFPVIVSRAVVDLLPEPRRAGCEPLGAARLKGKQREVEVFGVR
ncbi:MAG TPA: adenylate/guanylate cyclase domain-containing protein [Polyangia bacterium]|jgi:class 3 adenylate cyclase